MSDAYNYIGKYIEQKNVIFQNINELKNLGTQIINNDTLLYIPLETSDRFTPYPNTRAHGHIKYKFFFNTDFTDWKKYFTLKRNLDREKSLMCHLNINDDEPFNLVNRNYGTPPNFLKNELVNTNNQYRTIEMDFLDDYNIFDWIGVALKAVEIHTVETSLYYILEKLGVEDSVYIYSKYKDNDDYSYMKSHCSPKWNYM